MRRLTFFYIIFMLFALPYCTTLSDNIHRKAASLPELKYLPAYGLSLLGLPFWLYTSDSYNNIVSSNNNSNNNNDSNKKLSCNLTIVFLKLVLLKIHVIYPLLINFKAKRKVKGNLISVSLAKSVLNTVLH